MGGRITGGVYMARSTKSGSSRRRSCLATDSRPRPGVRQRQRETEFYECAVILSIRNDTSVDLEIIPAQSAIRPIQYQSHETSRTLDAHLDEALEKGRR